MKKKIMLSAVRRGMLGAPLGLAIGYLLTILFSLCFADGYYAPCVPQLTTLMGSEIRAVLLQAALCALLGTGFSASSVIWNIEHWGLLMQTACYFLLNSLIMLPTAYFLFWMEHSIAGFIRYFGIFFLVFVLIWIIEYAVGKHTVKKMNASLSGHQDTAE